jgi:DNA-binding response OmpR family regulator
MSSELVLNGRRILIAEDDDLIASLYADELKLRGANVVGPVSDVAQALLALERETNIDAAIVDVMLRGSVAYCLAEQLGRRGIPFAFVTALGTDMIPGTWQSIKFLQKPFEIDKLIEAVASLCLQSKPSK